MEAINPSGLAHLSAALGHKPIQGNAGRISHSRDGIKPTGHADRVDKPHMAQTLNAFLAQAGE